MSICSLYFPHIEILVSKHSLNKITDNSEFYKTTFTRSQNILIEKRNTKELIVEKAMKLFSVNGYKSVTVRMIASEVGIRDSGLYKHFPSKKAIFNAIVEKAKEQFLNRAEVSKIQDIRLTTMKDSCLSMFAFQTQDPWAVGLRRILMSEMFHDEEMANIYKKFFIDMPINNEGKLFEKLMEQGFMKKGDPYVAAMELYAPFFLYHSVTYDLNELERKFSIHVDNFINNNF